MVTETTDIRDSTLVRVRKYPHYPLNMVCFLTACKHENVYDFDKAPDDGSKSVLFAVPDYPASNYQGRVFGSNFDDVVIQLVQGLAFLHERGVVHGNLRLNSVCLTKGKYKLDYLEHLHRVTDRREFREEVMDFVLTLVNFSRLDYDVELFASLRSSPDKVLSQIDLYGDVALDYWLEFFFYCLHEDVTAVELRDYILANEKYGRYVTGIASTRSVQDCYTDLAKVYPSVASELATNLFRDLGEISVEAVSTALASERPVYDFAELGS